MVGDRPTLSETRHADMVPAFHVQCEIFPRTSSVPPTLYHT